MRSTETRGRPPAVRAALRVGPAAAGCGLLVVAVLLAPDHARAAAAQDWPPFVLVAGLLLVGLVANGDGLFAAGGHALARLSPNGLILYAGTAVLVVTVTTLLNLDTSVTFLTPVLVYAARSRGEGEAPLLYACLLLSNAGSLLLPGSNLTNLIVLGHLHLSGGAFLAHMALPALAAAVVTALVVGAAVPPLPPDDRGADHRARTTRPRCGPAGGRGGHGARAGAARAGAAGGRGRRGGRAAPLAPGRRRAAVSPRAALDILGVPVLVALFGLAVALGTLGRSWSGPATLLSHLDAWGTAAVAALSSVLVNNLPAASLLAARQPPHPFALLVGLNVGPNLFVTGSLAWFLWLRAARAAGGHPDIRRASLLGLASAPLAMAAAVGLLVLSGTG